MLSLQCWPKPPSGAAMTGRVLSVGVRIVVFTVAVLMAHVDDAVGTGVPSAAPSASPSTSPTLNTSSNHAAERQALMDLYYATDGENWNPLCSWTANITAGVDHCDWCRHPLPLLTLHSRAQVGRVVPASADHPG